MTVALELIGLGGGCHWCTEAIFQHLRGVRDVKQGFMASTPSDEALSEAIQLRFDPASVPLQVLIAAHLSTHSSTSDHVLRARYRSAVYAVNRKQAERARAALDELQREWNAPLVTAVLPLERFELNDSAYHNYYLRRPEAPFCRAHIEPKLATLRAHFADYYCDASRPS